MSKKASCLLSGSVVPKSYHLQLKPDFETFTFSGFVSILVNILEPVREITLHAVDLKIETSAVNIQCALESIPAYPPLYPGEVRLDEEAETVTFVFAVELPVGNARLNIKYSGMLNDKMAGFYRSQYPGKNGQTSYLGVTQFEATDARRALPCWDEPARKARFHVSLVAPDHMAVLSNMPVEFDSFDKGLRTVDFAVTPTMSSYLLAWVVGELEYIETATNNGTRVRVYTIPGKSEFGRFALDTAKRVLEFYNEYFGIPYPLPKLDLVAVPDFSAGAMENWGLVTYRENALLIDPANSSAAAYQRVAEVVAHELAHQWFGNLVTMQWWTHLWLNEGFATWMASFVLDHLFPEWDIWTQFVGDEYASALSLDGLRSTHPIEVEVGHPNEISQIFDAISYSKGASVIRMIHDYIGAEAFRTGLQIYLQRHAYNNATTEDLWRALSEASGQSVGEIMETWTKQAGYPLVKVSSGLAGTMVVTQERFLAGGNALTVEEFYQRWRIPLVFTQRRSFQKPALGKTMISFSIKEIRGVDGEVGKLNSGQIALVRINYTSQQWQKLAEEVENGELTPIDRYGVLSDALALTRAGHLSTSQLVNLLSSYKKEENYTVWTAVLGVLGALDNVIEETSGEIFWGAFARSLLRPIGEKLGWDGNADEVHTTKLLRAEVLNMLGGYGDYETVTIAKSRFYDHFSGARSLDPNLRAAVYDIIAKHGNSTQSLNVLYEKENLQEEKVRLLRAMGKFVDSAILSAVLDYGFNSGKVRPGDCIYFLATMGSHARGRRVAWQFVKDNWDKIHGQYSSGGLAMLPHIINLTCSGFARFTDAEEIEQFFKDYPAPSATRAVAEAVERIRIRAAWYERDKDQIIAAFLHSK